MMYFFAFRESAIRVDKLRLLVHKLERLETTHFPLTEDDKKKFEGEVGRIADSWNQLQEEGRIGTLMIKYYPFDPMYHFMIIDGKKLHFGLFRSKCDYPGTDLLNTFITSNDTAVGRKLVGDFMIEFETVWKEFGLSKQQ
jgi:hypothetical protein